LKIARIIFAVTVLFITGFFVVKANDDTETTQRTVADSGRDGITLDNERLTEAFSELKPAVVDLSVAVSSSSSAVTDTKQISETAKVTNGENGKSEYKLDSNVKITTEYAAKEGSTQANGQVKQTITLDNPTDQDLTTNVTVNHMIRGTTFSWDGKEYTATDSVQTFTPYEGSSAVKPKDEATKAELKKLPKIEAPASRGLDFQFKTKNEQGEDAIFTYDASDLKPFSPIFTIQKDGESIKLAVALENITAKSNGQTVLDPTYELTTASNYSMRYTFDPVTGEVLRIAQIGDVNGDGTGDLIISDYYADSNSRADSGSVYVIYSSLLANITGTGNTISLGTTTNYNLRFDGATINDEFGQSVAAGDLTNDGKPDLVISAYTSFNGRVNSGSFYVISNSIFASATGTGNTFDMNNSSKYTARLDGSAASSFLQLSIPKIGDVNHNGINDLLIMDKGINSKGRIYIIYDSKLLTMSGSVDLATSSNYNLIVSGANDNDTFGWNGFGVKDFNNDGRLDLIVGSGGSNNGRASSGSVYILYNSLIGDYSSTGNSISMSSSSNYNIRIDGGAASGYLGYSDARRGPGIGDIDGDGTLDLAISTDGISDSLVSSGKGSLLIIYNQLLSGLTGTGNTVDTANSTKWNLRIDGAADSDYWVDGSTDLVDYNNDGKADLVAGSRYVNAYYVVYSSLLGSYGITGATTSLSNPSNYSIRYTTLNDDLGEYSGAILGNISGFGNYDFVTTDDDGNEAKPVVIRNFPHTLTIGGLSSAVSSTLHTVTGTVSAANSVTTISKVQYQLDGASPSLGWTDCSATDGSFNSRSEGYSCGSLNLRTAGGHTVYVRAMDTNGVYTAATNYASMSTYFTIPANPSPSPSPTPSPSPSPSPSYPAVTKQQLPALGIAGITFKTFGRARALFTYVASRNPRPIFRGKTTKNYTVTILDNDTVLCKTKADKKGNWTCKLPTLKYLIYDTNLRITDTDDNIVGQTGFRMAVRRPVVKH
jgi:hypothetical protein